MKKLVCLSLLLLVMVSHVCAFQVNYKGIASHPRLFLKAGEEKAVLESVNRSELWKFQHQVVIDQCNLLLNEPLLTYKKQGIRLSITGEALRRVFFLSYGYRTTGEKRFAERAVAEMEALSKMKDWNPSHFLDVATITTGVAIGYDWLQDFLTPAQRKLIAEGIVKNGLLPSKDPKYDGFTRRTNNWNQVCNSGMVVGALAVYDEYPELARELIDRAVNTIGISMGEYAPEGVYPEGYGYWGYGTNFNVVMIAALESALQTDANLPQMKGFMESAYFINYMLGTSGKAYNYGDAGERCVSFAALNWFAGKLNDNGVLWNEKVLASKGLTANLYKGDTFLPFSLLCTRLLKDATISHPKGNCWVGHGETPLMMVRTSWEGNEGCYLALKGSKAFMSHGHMDAGSFVFDALGERWACDLGGQSYYLLEKVGLSLWDYNQGGDRWKIFRYNNAVHNTLNIKGNLHLVNGFVDFDQVLTRGKEMGAVLNMTPLYDSRVKEAKRKLVIVKERELLVDDQVTTADKPVTMEWVLCTQAEAKELDASTWELTQHGKRVKMVVKAPAGFKITMKDNVPPHEYDEPNKGSRRVVVEATIPASSTQHIVVRLIPQK